MAWVVRSPGDPVSSYLYEDLWVKEPSAHGRPDWMWTDRARDAYRFNDEADAVAWVLEYDDVAGLRVEEVGCNAI